MKNCPYHLWTTHMVYGHHHQETRWSFFLWGCSKNLGTISYHPLLFANVFDRNWPKNYRAWNWPQIFTFLPLSLLYIERWFIIEVWRRICFIKVVATGNTTMDGALIIHWLFEMKKLLISAIWYLIEQYSLILFSSVRICICIYIKKDSIWKLNKIGLQGGSA